MGGGMRSEEVRERGGKERRKDGEKGIWRDEESKEGEKESRRDGEKKGWRGGD